MTLDDAGQSQGQDGSAMHISGQPQLGGPAPECRKLQAERA